MADHDPLGLAGGTGSENHRRHAGTVRARFRGRLRVAGAVTQAFQLTCHRLRVVGMLVGCVGNAAGEIHHAGLRFGPKARHFAPCHARIDTTRPSAQTAAGQNQRHMLRAVLGNRQHAVTWQDAQALQLCGQRVHPAPQI